MEANWTAQITEARTGAVLAHSFMYGHTEATAHEDFFRMVRQEKANGSHAICELRFCGKLRYRTVVGGPV